METFDDEKPNIKIILKDAAKAARIYELILDNINLDKINTTLVDTENLNNLDSTSYLKYIKEIGNKKEKNEGKINTFTTAFKSLLNLIISEFQNGSDFSNDLYKLSACYYFFKFRESNDSDEENDYINKIDSVVDKILLSKNYYYKILELVEQFKEEEIIGKNKKAKNDAYFKILFYLNEVFLGDLLIQYMEKKKAFYPQYAIPLPSISFKEKDLDIKIKKIYNILYVLQKTESFKTKQRFEYFHTFKSEPELLDEINYVLKYTNKSPIVSLDNIDNEIAEEAINYSLDSIKKQQKNEDIISELSLLLEEGKKAQERARAQYNEISTKYQNLLQEYYEEDKNYTNKLNELEAKIKELKNNQTKSNEESNIKTSEINSLKASLQKNEEIIERISY